MRIQSGWLVSVPPNAKRMATTTMVKNAAALFLLLLLLSAGAEGCTEELTSFSACLSYVSYPPNNLTESASDKCCNAFSSAVDSLCLCYLLRDPLILGFPLNTTRLLSLSSLCPSPTSTSFAFLCSASPALPPLNGAPIQTLGTAPAPAPAGSGARSGSSGKRESSERTVPKATSGAGTVFYFPPLNGSTLTPHITLMFSQFLAILVTLLNT
ncbi:Bifunctional inhibitor/plant lipid transfer protein/seed storage helical domain [Spatholobus suberectus]|nr:Bifunctional inhibitor/plant lipid transfer protein/seed storage helical domain [Spatholobus suberectus]